MSLTLKSRWIWSTVAVVLVWATLSPVLVGFWLVLSTSHSPAVPEGLAFGLRTLGLTLIVLGPLAGVLFVSILGALVLLMLAAARYLWLLATTAGTLVSTGATPSARPEPSTDLRALQKLKDAIAERRWPDVEELFRLLQQDNADLAREMEPIIRREREAHTRELQEALEQARNQNNPQAVLDVRDKLAALLELHERQDLDREIARWSMVYLREALHEGRARELIDLIERMVATFGESTTEGMELKNALPILRRSAGRCPDCGQPYDISMERCPECEHKRQLRLGKGSPFEEGDNGGPMKWQRPPEDGPNARPQDGDASS